MWGKKQGYCQICRKDLGMVHIATKFCKVHKKQMQIEYGRSYNRSLYKSQYGRQRVFSGGFRNPEPIPKGLTLGGYCPGNGNGFCGKILHAERCMNDEGYSTNEFDFICGTHRFRAAPGKFVP